METRARARFMRGSARKMRQVVDLVRGKPVDQALNMLSMLPKSAAVPVFKTVKSAAANALAAEGTAHLKTENLSIKKIYVDGGPIMKRIRPMGMGRAYRINKRMCHLTVVLEGDADAVTGTGPAAKKASSSSRSAGTKSKAAKKKSSGSARASAKPAARRGGQAAAGKSGSTRRPARTKKGS
jgi:large subunit ribosomal protein L22